MESRSHLIVLVRGHHEQVYVAPLRQAVYLPHLHGTLVIAVDDFHLHVLVEEVLGSEELVVELVAPVADGALGYAYLIYWLFLRTGRKDCEHEQ